MQEKTLQCVHLLPWRRCYRRTPNSSNVHIHAPLAAARHSPSKLGLCARLAQTFVEHGDVTVHLHGFVASAATIIAMGAKKIVMGEFALFLMHRCSNWVDTWGQMNAEEIADAIKKLEASKNALETIDQTVANIYAARCGKKVKDVAEWMKDAVWLNADDCKQRGLVDEICKDEVHPVITDALKEEILACGFPVPENRQEKGADMSLRSFLEGMLSPCSVFT